MPAAGDDKSTPQMLEMKKMEDFLNAQDKEVY
jgi:hypothetical protein